MWIELTGDSFDGYEVAVNIDQIYSITRGAEDEGCVLYFNGVDKDGCPITIEVKEKYEYVLAVLQDRSPPIDHAMRDMLIQKRET